ncbi:MAG: signal peptidase I [Firmicutes bacterium]|nr:signal peptidase I [Bacillota bacterium]
MKKSKGVRDVIRMILLIVCGLILGINVYMANAKSLVGNQMPMPFGYGAAVVLSGSMEPAMSVGDLILVQEAASFAEGDVVVYQDINSLVVHRVIKVNDKSVVTKGDANNVADGKIALEQVKGKVFFTIPMIGHLVNFMKSGVGTVLTLIAAFLLIEIPRRREKQRDDEQRQAILEEIQRLRNEE